VEPLAVFIALVKYAFVGLLAVEVALMVRALVTLARDKASAAALAPAAEE
jgi:putative flippase GtrA